MISHLFKESFAMLFHGTMELLIYHYELLLLFWKLFYYYDVILVPLLTLVLLRDYAIVEFSGLFVR